MRCDTGIPSLVIRLSTEQPTSGFGLLGRQCPGAQATTDDGLVAGYGGFRE